VRTTRLFHTLIICGAALTGGAVTTVVAAAGVAGCACDDTTITVPDMAGLPIIEAQRDMSMVIIDAFIPFDLATKD
jgi:hypothetical protein